MNINQDDCCKGELSLDGWLYHSEECEAEHSGPFVYVPSGKPVVFHPELHFGDEV